MYEKPIDRAIREAAERGEFDNLPGAGKPLQDTAPHSERWYLEQFALREDSGSAFLPNSLLLRKEGADLPAKVAQLSSEAKVREAVADLNRRITDEIRMPTGGPPLAMRLLDADDVVADWAAERERRRIEREAAAAVAARPPKARRWWSRRTDR
jgi:hypothetical protein